MTAKELFFKLGYEQKIYNNEKRFVNSFEYTVNGIEYVKREEKTERMTQTKNISFYRSSKEIEIHTSYEFDDGTTETSESVILNMELINAIQKQINELEWNNESDASY